MPFNQPPYRLGHWTRMLIGHFLISWFSVVFLFLFCLFVCLFVVVVVLQSPATTFSLQAAPRLVLYCSGHLRWMMAARGQTVGWLSLFYARSTDTVTLEATLVSKNSYAVYHSTVYTEGHSPHRLYALTTAGNPYNTFRLWRQHDKARNVFMF